MKINKGTLIVAAATVAVIILAIVAISSVPANAIAYAEKVTEAKSAIKVQEKRRADLYPNLVDCVQTYDQHEYQTLVDIVNARTGQDGTISDEAVNEIKAALKVVVEAYPDLDSQSNF